MKKYFIGLIGGLIGAIINVIFLFFASDIEMEV